MGNKRTEGACWGKIKHGEGYRKKICLRGVLFLK